MTGPLIPSWTCRYCQKINYATSKRCECCQAKGSHMTDARTPAHAPQCMCDECVPDRSQPVPSHLIHEAAPTTDARTTIREIVVQISDTAPLSAENIDRAVELIHDAVAAPTITPQSRESIEALRRDPLAARSIDAAVHEHWWNDALDAVLAVLDGVGGSITPETDREIEFYEQGYRYGKFGELPGGGSITPADQEDTDDRA